LKAAAIISARIQSTRLHRKVLIELCGKTILEHVIDRCRRFPEINTGNMVLAIPDTSENDVLAYAGENLGIKVHRGSEDDVLGRIIGAGRSVSADVIYRVTSDNPLISNLVVRNTWEGFINGEWDYAVMENTPLGTTAEIVTMDTLERVEQDTIDSQHREHPTLFMYENSNLFRMNLMSPPDEWNHIDWRFTVDTEKDLALAKKIFGQLGPDADLDEIVPFLSANPEVPGINADVEQQNWTSLKEKKDEISRTSV
jgi:spore coat polysaccharide biosynthesis protein SpsF